jgi:glyoxylase-like metal-dependent hydrolase (beta-lactamase superfamily II)
MIVCRGRLQLRILSLTCNRTHCYLLEAGSGFVLIDTDFPDTLHFLMRLLKQHELKISDIKYLIVTHFHPDHAGIAQDLKNAGVKLAVHECQVSYIEKLNGFFKKNRNFHFTNIVLEHNIVISDGESRKFLKGVGIDGEIIQTPGHTDDSITLIVDGCCAFTGDLPDYALVEAYGDQAIEDSWKLIKYHKVAAIYPAHGNPYTI